MAYTADIGRTFWYEFDRRTNPRYSNFLPTMQQAGALSIGTVFANTRAAGTYPAKFVAFITPRKPAWQAVAEMQTSAISQFLGTDWADIQAAFEDFGQGTLLDRHQERKPDDIIHTMDTGAAPPIEYHRWHGSIRAIQLLGIGDSDWWENLNRFLGLAWGIQSFAKPKQQPVANQPVSGGDLQALRDAWLNLDPERRNRQYDLTGDVGYHPSPLQPVA